MAKIQQPKARWPLPKHHARNAIIENKIFKVKEEKKTTSFDDRRIHLNLFLSHFDLMVFIKRLWMKVGWALRESKQGPLTASRLETHFPQYWFGLYSPRKLSNFNRYPYWVWGEIDKENNIADNHKWIEFEHNWDELQCLKIELFQKWA